MTKLQIEKLCVWSGAVSVVLFFGGFIIAGFVPPMSPSLSMAQVVAVYQQNAPMIRIGMIVMMVSGMFMAPFVGAISVQMKRIPDVSPSLVYAQISTGTTNTMFFFIPAVMFLVTAFRPDRPPEITYFMNDFCWIMAIIPWPPALMQSVVIGLAVINDKSPAPVFPRWFAYLNFWVAFGYIPGGLLAFFKVGPFAWNGLFAFWLAGPVFVIWFAATVVLLLKAVKQQERAAALAPGLRTA